MKKIPLLMNLKHMSSLLMFRASEIEEPRELKAVVFGEGSWSSVLLSWKYNQNTPPVKFNIYVKNGEIKDGGGFRKVYTIHDKKYVANYITIGHEYTYYVTAVTPAGESRPSNIIEVNIPAMLNKVRTVTEKTSVQNRGENNNTAIKAAAEITRGQGEAAAIDHTVFSRKIDSILYKYNSHEEDYGEKAIREN